MNTLWYYLVLPCTSSDSYSLAEAFFPDKSLLELTLTEKPNEKWLTDVTEFKWYEGMEVRKLYLSAILDLCDRRIVSYVLSEHNDNPLVYKTFDKAVKANPNAHPLFHSDRGFQYTSRTFHHKLVQAGMTQSR